MADDFVRAYDRAMVERYGVSVVTSAAGVAHYVTAVPTIGAVPVLSGLPEEWFAAQTLPAINVALVGLLPDPTRNMPAFVPTAPSTTVPNAFEVGVAPTPVRLMYNVQLAAETRQHLNALVLHTIQKFPPLGYGSFLSVFGNMTNMRQTGFRDLTPGQSLRVQGVDETSKGRYLVFEYTYVVDGWLGQTDDSGDPVVTVVPAVQSLHITLEPHPRGVVLPAAETPEGTVVIDIETP